MTTAGVEAPSNAGPEADCPVCRMEVDPATARDSMEHGGTTCAFCDRGYRERFQVRPEIFLAQRREASLSPVMLD